MKEAGDGLQRGEVMPTERKFSSIMMEDPLVPFRTGDLELAYLHFEAFDPPSKNMKRLDAVKQLVCLSV